MGGDEILLNSGTVVIFPCISRCSELPLPLFSLSIPPGFPGCAGDKGGLRRGNVWLRALPECCADDRGGGLGNE